MRQLAVIVAVGLIAASCTASSSSTSDGVSTTPSVATSTSTSQFPTIASPADLDLVRRELLEMAEEDQEERSHFGETDAAPWQDEKRTARLMEIIELYGWPSPGLVGDEASSAAWLIAQHSDADPEFQQRVLEMLEASVEDYPGKAENIALLTDRVAANTNQRQRFGSQIGCLNGDPIPRPDLADPDQVDQLRTDAGLEPLHVYLARFDEHCTDLARLPIDAGCQPVSGVEALFSRNTAVLVGELHGTVESPAFVAALTCTAVSYGYEVNVGLEIPDDETQVVETFLASDGGPQARAALLAGQFWSTGFPEGRQSTAMLDLLDDLRQLKLNGAELSVMLLDAAGAADRDTAMAQRLLAAMAATPEAFAITLTGNLHSRNVRGVSFDADYQPMGFLVSEALPAGAVLTVDVQYSGGSAWTCSENGTCAPNTFGGNIPGLDPDAAPAPAVAIDSEGNADGHDGHYYVGELSPAGPAADQAD